MTSICLILFIILAWNPPICKFIRTNIYFVAIFVHTSILFALVNAEIICWNCQRDQNVTLSNFFVIRNVSELDLYRN